MFSLSGHTDNQEEDKDRCYYFISFVCCNFRVRNIVFFFFSITFKCVDIDILRSFLPSCSTGSIYLPLTPSFHSFSRDAWICLIVIGLLSPLGRVKTFRKDVMISLCSLFCVCVVLSNFRLGGGGREDCTSLTRKNMLFSHQLIISTHCQVWQALVLLTSIPQGTPRTSTVPDTAAAWCQSFLCVTGTAATLAGVS